MKIESNLEEEIKKLKQKYWDELVKTANSKNTRKRRSELRDKHIDDYRDMLAKHGLFNSDTPFQFASKEAEQRFMAEFQELGHTNIYSRLCRCCNDDIIG